MEGVLVGTGSNAGGGLAIEGTSKVSWVGFSTDPTELVDFFSLTQDPATGAVNEFYLQTYNPCCTPLGRFRSPANNIGAWGYPQRNYRAVSRTMCQPNGANGPLTPAIQTVCHMDPLAVPDSTARQADQTPTPIGLTPGQYTLPVFEFIFAENLNFGTPLVENNFQDLPFLFCGSGPIDGLGSGTTVVGQLDPAPWALPMPDPIFHSTLCPSAKAVGAAVVAVGPALPQTAVINSVTAVSATATVGVLTTVVLTATATDPNTPANLSYAWTAPAGVSMSCGVCAPNAANAKVFATFNAKATGTMIFGVTVANGVPPSATRTVAVTVLAAGAGKAPTIKSFTATPQAPAGGALVTLTAVGNANPAAPAPTGTVTFSFNQTGGPAVTLSAGTKTGTAPADQTAKVTFTAPRSTVKTNLTFQVIATNSTGASTTSGTITVAVQPAPADTVAFLGGVVNYLNLGNVGGVVSQRGKLTISVISTATPAPLGMTMTATFFNNTLPANVPGSSALPITVPLILTAADPVGTLVPVCGPTPCWTALVSTVIDNLAGLLVPPTTVTVRSSLGGTATVTGAAIVNQINKRSGNRSSTEVRGNCHLDSFRRTRRTLYELKPFITVAIIVLQRGRLPEGCPLCLWRGAHRTDDDLLIESPGVPCRLSVKSRVRRPHQE